MATHNKPDLTIDELNKAIQEHLSARTETQTQKDLSQPRTEAMDAGIDALEGGKVTDSTQISVAVDSVVEVPGGDNVVELAVVEKSGETSGLAEGSVAGVSTLLIEAEVPAVNELSEAMTIVEDVVAKLGVQEDADTEGDCEGTQFKVVKEKVQEGSDEALVSVAETEVKDTLQAAQADMEQGMGNESPSTRALRQLNEMAEIADQKRNQATESVSPTILKPVLINSSEDEDEPSRKTSTRKRKTLATRRSQPSRPGKKPMTSSRKGKEVQVPEQEAEEVVAVDKPKIVLDEFCIDKDFLKENQLEEVYDLIKFQGWDHLFKDDEKVDKELVVEFYKKVSKVEKGAIMYLNFEFKGQELTVSSRDLAHDLGLKHEGFDTFTKRQWPDDISEEVKEDMERRVCSYHDPNVNDLTSLYMEPKMKILHRLLVHTILPRGSKPALAQIQDILVLDQILKKKKVNLPKLIIHQMEYVSKYQHVGHARIVKKILEVQNVYQPTTEVSVMKPLSLHAIHRWGILFDEKKGWIRKTVLADEVLEEHFQREADEEHSLVVDRLKRIEKSMDEIKDGLSDLKAEVEKLATGQWVIEEELNGLVKAIKEGFKGLMKASGTGSRT